MNSRNSKVGRVDESVREAIHVGYLQLSTGSRRANEDAYLRRCRELRIPMTILRIGVRWAKVEIDIEPARLRLTDKGTWGLLKFLEKILGRGKVRGGGGMETHRVEKIPLELGQTVALGLRDYMIANSSEVASAQKWTHPAPSGGGVGKG